MCPTINLLCPKVSNLSQLVTQTLSPGMTISNTDAFFRTQTLSSEMHKQKFDL